MANFEWAKAAALGCVLLSLGCSDGSDGDPGDPGTCPAAFATNVVEFEFGDGQDFGQEPGEFPENVLGPPRGAGCCTGGLHVSSLGNGGYVVLEFENTVVVDGEGPDFIVFENAFEFGTDDVFAEVATVSVSGDGETYVDFPCTAMEPPWGACAGVGPVFAHEDDPDVDPLDPAVAGGDSFDLSEVGMLEARFVKITDRSDLTGIDGVFDLDAVGIVHGRCR